MTIFFKYFCLQMMIRCTSGQIICPDAQHVTCSTMRWLKNLEICIYPLVALMFSVACAFLKMENRKFVRPVILNSFLSADCICDEASKSICQVSIVPVLRILWITLVLPLCFYSVSNNLDNQEILIFSRSLPQNFIENEIKSVNFIILLIKYNDFNSSCFDFVLFWQFF